MNANIVRSFTNPIYHPPRLQSSNSSTSVTQLASNHDSHNSTNSQPSRNSDSTQNTSASTLFGPPTSSSMTASNSSMVTATDNVINRIADKDASLFQVCMTLKARLTGIPGFEEQVVEVEDELGNEDIDPVMLLWNVFRKGHPLLLIFNALNPREKLVVEESSASEAKRSQMAAYKFLNACIKDLGFDPQDCYLISDLKGGARDINMSGFSKVVRQVGRVADILTQKGVIESLDGQDVHTSSMPHAKRTHREHILDELVRTERTYVQHIELLQGFSKHVRHNGIIPGDAIHDIFLNLDELLEFQRRFLVKVEQTNAQHEIDQNWGKLFFIHARPGHPANGGKDFSVYEPFIENQKRCEETTMREFDKLRQAGGPVELRQMVESPTHLTAFLLKPFQRLAKYPLLLKELRNKGGLSQALQDDLTAAIDAVTAVLNRTNASIDQEDRRHAVRELKAQVEDWKHHRVEAFGELLLYGTHTVLKGDPGKESNEREYRMYLFEKILLCCKEINPNKTKNKVKPQAALDRRGKPRLQLKGRIFMQNVTETVFATKPGHYTCQIYWRGDDTIEHFVIKFATEDLMKKWRDRMEEQRQICLEQMRLQNQQGENDFYTAGGHARENPYRDDGQDDEDSEATSIGYAESGHMPGSRNGSSTSLRSRSTTGESGPPGRHGKPGMTLTNLPPIATHAAGAMDSPMSPGERMGAGSYFSPGLESPKSSRTSQSSAHFPGTGMRGPSYQNGFYGEEHNRYTAPARSSLAQHAQGNAHAGAYPPHYGPSQTSRLRSASNPDVQNAAGRRGAANAPPVPSVPHHLAHGTGINRSQTNSPMIGEDGYQDGQLNPAVFSPPLGSAATMDGASPSPSQLKVKVKVPSEGSTMTLVVGYNITFEKLKDRIDAKLSRNTNVTLASGMVKLKYFDDDDYVSMQTDDDLQNAFETYKEQQGKDIVGQLGEIQLYCMKTET